MRASVLSFYHELWESNSDCQPTCEEALLTIGLVPGFEEGKKDKDETKKPNQTKTKQTSTKDH